MQNDKSLRLDLIKKELNFLRAQYRDLLPLIRNHSNYYGFYEDHPCRRTDDINTILQRARLHEKIQQLEKQLENMRALELDGGLEKIACCFSFGK